MSNEYKDWFEEYKKELYWLKQRLCEGAIYGLKIEDVVDFIAHLEYTDFGTLSISKTKNDDYAMKIDDETIKRWKENEKS